MENRCFVKIMCLSKITWLSKVIVAGCLLMTCASSAMAQRFQPFGPLDLADEFQPFAPAEVGSFGDGPQPHTGLFFTYDRVNWYVSRPARAQQDKELDLTWGNRIDFGYMTKENHGWLVEILHIDGPNVEGFDNSDPQNIVRTSVENSFDLSGFEVSKLWRWKQFHGGSHLEIFAGGRYDRMRGADNLFRVLDATRLAVLDPEIIGNVTAVNFGGIAYENNVFGPQVGLRWFKQKGRWTFSSEGRYYYAYNDQFYASRQTIVGGTAFFDVDEQSWVHAGDIRVQTSLTCTKNINLALGWEFLYYANGIGRGPFGESDQDVTMTGVTFGFQCNR